MDPFIQKMLATAREVAADKAAIAHLDFPARDYDEDEDDDE